MRDTAHLERIRALTDQLLRAEHPAVVLTVATQLHLALDEYLKEAARSESEAGAILSPITAQA